MAARWVDVKEQLQGCHRHSTLTTDVERTNERAALCMFLFSPLLEPLLGSFACELND